MDLLITIFYLVSCHPVSCILFVKYYTKFQIKIKWILKKIEINRRLTLINPDEHGLKKRSKSG